MSVRLACCSWNVNGLPPQDVNLDEWLHLQAEVVDDLSDIYVIGLQEVPADPSSLVLDYYIRNDPWTKRLLLFLSHKGIVMVDYVRMMGMLLIVAVKPNHLEHIRNIRVTYTKTALYGLLGTKGAVSLRFDLYGESFCFINAHFVAGPNYTEHRNNTYQSVISKTLFNNCEKPSIFDNRYIIFFGDLNYRINSLDMETLKKYVNEKDYKSIASQDQLLASQVDGKCFDGFTEFFIDFPPTYKYDVKTNNFDTSTKQRLPAYTDRILWKEMTTEVSSMQQTNYKSHMSLTSSDHKPISGEFIINIPAMLSAKPQVEFRFDDSYIPWTSEEDGVCVFYVHGYQTSSWDWVGLYPVGFKSPKDYFTYEWSVSGADETGEDGCMVLFDDVPEEHGFYLFGYWSRRLECMLGLSEPFKVAPVPEPEDPQEITVENPPESNDVQ